MSDRAALLAAVLANPDDDTPRLVYADYLDETGDPADAARAEFIRLEVEADRLPAGAEERVAVEARTAVLLRRHIAVWNRELPGWATGVFYRRGFPYALTMDHDRFAASAAEAFDVAPIQSLELVGPFERPSPPTLPTFALPLIRRPQFLARVRGLRLSVWEDEFGYVGPMHPRSVCQLPHLTGLRVLDLSNVGIESEWVIGLAREFAAAPFARVLRELLLSDNAIADDAALALAAAPGLDRLSRMDLRNNRLTPTGLGPLRVRFGNRLEV